MDPREHNRRASDNGADQATQPANGRRATDRRGNGDRRRGDRREGGDRRTRDLMQRYRQPIIGLGLAGLALPLMRSASDSDTEGAPGDEPLGDVARASDALLPAPDMEEALAEQIALSKEDAARTSQVQEAVDRYNISQDLAEDIYDFAREAEIEPKLAYGLVKTESTFNERAVSPVGARGLTQVMPRTAAWLVPGTRTQDLYDRHTNLRLGFKYLNQMIDKYDGNVRLALLAYNRGPGTVDRVLRQGGNPDNGYADKVLRG